MSKRYGRNQKRRAREAILRLSRETSRLSEAYNMTAGLCSNLGNKLRDKEYQIKEIMTSIERICYHSATLPAKEKKVSGEIDPRDPYMMSILFMPEPELSVSFDQVYNIYHKEVCLHALEIFLRENREKFNMAVHLRQVSTGGYSVYYISEEAFKSIPKEILVNELMPDILKQLINHLRNSKRSN